MTRPEWLRHPWQRYHRALADSANRVFTKATGPMIAASAEPVMARDRAIREAKHNRLVYVCAWCAPDAVKKALDGLENVSHGCCDACSEKVLGGTL
jgi:hypothetical protein